MGGNIHIAHPGDSKRYDRMGNIIEGIFLIECLLHFITFYRDPLSHNRPVRDLKKIMMNYVYGEFILDAFTLIPWSLILPRAPNLRYLYLIKCLRLPLAY